MGVIGALLVGYLMLGTRDVLPKSRTRVPRHHGGRSVARSDGRAPATSIELALSGTVPFATVLLARCSASTP